MSAAAEARRSDEFSGEYHVYEPHKVGLPPLGSYFRALWARRQFLYELARTNKRYGLVTMCIGGGQGIAAIIERI